MPYECFVPKRFIGRNGELIEQANSIIAEYQDQGFVLTLRQLYYQFVARALIPNTMQSYKRLGQVINDARLAGLVDWDALEDRTRNVRAKPSWSSPEDILGACASQFRIKRWADQPCHVEVWIEKDALVGVIERVCNEHLVPFFACRGYTSQSEQWRAGRRFARLAEEGKRVVVLHLGDHDPSGIDMTRDNIDRLSMFAGEEVEVRRLALNIEQVKKYRPPPNPAKESDSRCNGYKLRFGDKSWELDALDPRVIDGLIRDQLQELIDQDRWRDAIAREEKSRRLLSEAATRWDEVAELLDY
ncbi:hypothetical protein TSH58p_07345 [Azospirillum sp. TSH58]|uniref:hypothetical protein n=1 Tax=Azospirillum sp. TSH58 TaxID=664962 RepID=UPI000D602321|nr:hypothetical protein [Azospirillum sp. TSH58]AWJ83359.1 hypothetical protein TSH58p_07345 [Azospirillum sp. TSH58]PWC73106.1 hypothetical protein TSH58_05300 [Azospirillum sp. TSH58]